MNKLKGLTFGLLMTAVCSQALAVETLTLDQLRTEVLDENIDVKIQYEKYYQAQQNVGVKLGQFLPNLNFQLVFWNTPFALLYSLTPTPSNWFVYQSSQELEMAEKYITESIKLNILKDLTLTYVNILHQEKLMESMAKQEQSVREAYERARNLEQLGFGSESDTFTAERALLQHQNDMFALNAVIEAYKESLYMSLNRMPGTDIDLVEHQPTEENIPATVEEAIEIGLDNSPELKANLFMQAAVGYMVRSARWSFVSFSGIGFGYPSTVRLEGSRLTEVQLEGEKLKNQIANQINLAYEKLDNTKHRITVQMKILLSAQANLERVKQLYDVGQATLQELNEARVAVRGEERRLFALEMERNVQIIEIKRLIGVDATDDELTEEELASITLEAQKGKRRSGKTKVSVDLGISEALATEIVGVTYGGDVFDYRIVNSSNNFSLMTKTRSSGVQVVTAEILFRTGQTLTLETSVEL